LEVSRILLDTSAYSLLRLGHQAIRDAVETAELVCMCPIVLGELHSGFGAGRRRRQNEDLLRQFLDSPEVEIATMGEETSLCYAQIFGHLRQVGRPIPTNDLWIAACAMERGLQLITADAHFRHVPQIRLDLHEV
jgi:tRNA(fMet)-specific endonuclease VapC